MFESMREKWNNIPDKERKAKRLGLTVLGAAGVFFGANALINSVAYPALSATERVTSAAVGAGASYGGFLSTRRALELDKSIDSGQPEKQMKFTQRARYIGGTALTYLGANVAVLGFVVNAPVLLSVGAFAGGVYIASQGFQKIDESFEPSDELVSDRPSLRSRVVERLNRVTETVRAQFS